MLDGEFCFLPRENSRARRAAKRLHTECPTQCAVFSGAHRLGNLREDHAGYSFLLFSFWSRVERLRDVPEWIPPWWGCVVVLPGCGICDVDAATEMLIPLLRQYPNGAIVLFLCGRVAQLRGQFADALGYFQRSMEAQTDWKQYQHLCIWRACGKTIASVYCLPLNGTQWNFLNGILSMGCSSWDVVHGMLFMGRCSVGRCPWDVVHGMLFMDVVHGTLSMGCSSWDVVHGTLSMGRCQWDVLHGILTTSHGQHPWTTSHEQRPMDNVPLNNVPWTTSHEQHPMKNIPLFMDVSQGRCQWDVLHGTLSMDVVNGMLSMGGCSWDVVHLFWLFSNRCHCFMMDTWKPAIFRMCSSKRISGSKTTYAYLTVNAALYASNITCYFSYIKEIFFVIFLIFFIF